MSVAVIVAIVVAAGEASSPATTALLAAAQEALPPKTQVRLVESSVVSDLEALGIERAQRAGASAQVTWRDGARSRAVLRVHLAASDAWTTREIAFKAADTLAERGRTLGFAVASMWPEGNSSPRGAGAGSAGTSTARPGAESAPVVPAGAAPVGGTASVRGDESPGSAGSPVPAPNADQRSSGATDPERSSDGKAPAFVGADASSADKKVDDGAVAADALAAKNNDVESARSSEDSSRPTSPAARERQTFAVGLGGVGALGIGGPADGLGGAAEGLWFLSPDLGLRLCGEVRDGSVPQLPGSDVTAAAGVGGEWWPASLASDGIWAAGVRADLLLLRHQIRWDGDSTGSTSARGPESKGRFLPGADALVVGSARLASRFELVFGAGVEVAFGTTQLAKAPDFVTVATLPRTRIVGSFGLRWGF